MDPQQKRTQVSDFRLIHRVWTVLQLGLALVSWVRHGPTAEENTQFSIWIRLDSDSVGICVKADAGSIVAG